MARELLERLWRSDTGMGHFWIKPKSGSRTIWMESGVAFPTFPDDADVYFGVHPSHKTDGRSKVQTITQINCVFADFDGISDLDLITTITPSPSCVVQTSEDCYHAYWFTEPFPINTESDRLRAITLQANWTRHISIADQQVKDIARIMRVPNTRNQKEGKNKFLAGILIWQPENEYTIAELEEICTPIAPKSIGALQHYHPAVLMGGDAYANAAIVRNFHQMQHAVNGNRNGTLYAVAQGLASLYVAGRINESVFSELAELAIAKGLGRKEVEATIASARGSQIGLTPNTKGLPDSSDPPRSFTGVLRKAKDRQKGEDPVEVEKTPEENRKKKLGLQLEDLEKIWNAMGLEFEFDLIDDQIVVNGAELTDAIENAIYWATRKHANVSLTDVRTAISVVAAKKKRHFIREKLAAMEAAYDGADHIAALASMVSAGSDIIEYPDGKKRTAFEAALRRWLLGAVNRMQKGDQNFILVLTGKQGTGKSTFVETIGSPFGDYFRSGGIDPAANDDRIAMTSIAVWELSELPQVFRKADLDALKAAITQKFWDVRAPYARRSRKRQALASWIATTNAREILGDSTGWRRWFVFEVESINFDYSDINIEQVWGQACRLLQEGESPYLSKEEIDYQNKTNANYEVGDFIDQHLQTFFTKGDKDEGLTATEIIEHINTMTAKDDLKRDKVYQLNAKTYAQLAAAMKRVFNSVSQVVRKQRRYMGVRIADEVYIDDEE